MLKITALTLVSVATLAVPAVAQAPTPAPAMTRPSQAQAPAATRPAPAQAPAATRPAQPAAPTPVAPAAQPAKAPEPPGQPLNIMLELTITDQGGTGAPTKKTVNLIVADRQNGSVRSRGRVGPGRDVIINVDARPLITRDNVIRLDLGLEYQPVIDERVTAAAASPNPSPFPPEQSYSNLNQRISVLLDSGKPLVISQAADPGSTRQISVEVKATIAK